MNEGKIFRAIEGLDYKKGDEVGKEKAETKFNTAMANNNIHDAHVKSFEKEKQGRDIGSEIDAELAAEGVSVESYGVFLIKKFSGDISEIRNLKVNYDSMSDLDAKAMSGDLILAKANSVRSEILKAVNETKIGQEKGDIDNLRVELEDVIKNVVGSSESLSANG
jgi:hypothetical protein